MESIFILSWRRYALMVIFLVCTPGLKDVASQSLECLSCTDHGEGGCLPENAVIISCPSDYNMCLETIIAIKSIHSHHIVMKKGCSYGDETRLDRTLPFHGISMYNLLNQCNSSLCNSNLNLKNYQLAPDDTITQLPNEVQCYSCIGKPCKECSPSNAPVGQCYNSYTYCFDGIATISIDDDTTLIHIKSCTLRYRCAVQKLTYGSASFEIKGACCSGELCNQDLSNKTQLGDIPYLVLLDDNKAEVPTTAKPPPWLTPTNKLPTTKDTISKAGKAQPAPKSTASSSSSYQPQDDQTNNTIFALD